MLIKILCLTLIAVVLVQARPSEHGIVPSNQLAMKNLQMNPPNHRVRRLTLLNEKYSKPLEKGASWVSKKVKKVANKIDHKLSG